MSERRFLKAAEVCRRYGGVDRTTLWRWTKNADLGFPQPEPINRLNLWDADKLDAWDEARAAAEKAA